MTMKGKVLALLLFLVALSLNADNRKRKTSTLSPDSLPPSLSHGLVVPDRVATEDSTKAPHIDVGVPQWERYNINTVASGDHATWKGRLQHKLDSLSNTVMFETSQLGLYVYDITAGENLFAVNYRQRMRPASCEKLITAITALYCLGGDYQLHTDLRITGSISDGILDGDVYVVGRMDPLLSKSDVRALVRELQTTGVKRVEGHLYVDISFKDANEYGWGWCWDDKWGPLRVLTVDGMDDFAHEFLSALSAMGISVAVSVVEEALCPPSASLVCQRNHTIDKILQTMMKDSDNIFAESLFYHIAAFSGEREAERKQAVAQINGFISSQLRLDPSDYQVADGSGLSLYNYVSPQLIVEMLSYAWQNEGIRNHLYRSLPIAGSDGTLSRRMRGTAAQYNVHAKTGTVNGVSSLSGYANNSVGHVIAFCIINQGVFPAHLGRDFQDEVCQLLCQ